MNRIALIGLTAPLMLSLTACAGVSWKASAKCNTNGVCEAGIEASGTLLRSIVPETMLERIIRTNVEVDAAALELDLTGSNVGVPASGLLTASLVDSGTGATQASAVFSWHKVGNKLKLVDPDAVNNWALTHGGTADTFKYDLHPFNVGTTQGTNVFKVTQKVEGNSIISSSASWFRGGGGGCSEYAHCEAM